MQNKNMNTGYFNVFWDLDGVIFEYNMDDYLGPDPAYTKPGYFRHRKGDERACSIFTKMRNNKRVASLNVLSRGATRLPYEARVNVVNDKKECVEEKFPWLDKSHIFVTHDSKVESAEKILGRKLCKTDILIDDYNENLMMWQKAGGTAIKYINELNSIDSYSGPKLIGFELVDVPAELADVLKELVR